VVPLVLEPHQLAYGGWNQHASGNRVRLDVGDYGVRRKMLGVLLTGGDRTGLPMDRLVSNEE
jgi:hypothetical protein